MTPEAPSLFGNAPNRPPAGPALPAGPASLASARDPRDLMDLMYDGFYMIFLLRNGAAPTSEPEFRSRLQGFLTEFDRGAQRLQASPEDRSLAKFAFCALVDEVVLTSRLQIRDAWEMRPLQLEFFGEHLSGEKFFEHLDKLRQEGARRLQVLEIFHMALLLGFQGRYVLEGSEKLSYLTARLGDEIAHLRGSRPTFAPHWAAPDRIAHQLRSELPLWVIGSVFALVALLAFIGLSALLRTQTSRDLARYNDVVKLVPQQATVTITLP